MGRGIREENFNLLKLNLRWFILSDYDARKWHISLNSKPGPTLAFNLLLVLDYAYNNKWNGQCSVYYKISSKLYLWKLEYPMSGTLGTKTSRTIYFPKCFNIPASRSFKEWEYKKAIQYSVSQLKETYQPKIL